MKEARIGTAAHDRRRLHSGQRDDASVRTDGALHESCITRRSDVRWAQQHLAVQCQQLNAVGERQ